MNRVSRNVYFIRFIHKPMVDFKRIYVVKKKFMNNSFRDAIHDFYFSVYFVLG